METRDTVVTETSDVTSSGNRDQRAGGTRTLKERVGLTACPLPLPTCFRRKTRRVLAVSSILRVALILATIPLAVKSVKEGNFPGENHWVTFYWTDLLVIQL